MSVILMPTEPPELPFDLDFDSLCHWLAALPRSDREKRYTSLFAGLFALNSASPDPEFHFQALEELSVPVFQAAASMASVAIGKPFPLAVSVRKLAKMGAQFHSELARGYSKIAQEDGFGRRFDLQEQGRIVHSALRSFNQMLLHLALMYEAPPTSLWLRLNELYHQAERENLADWSVGCPELGHAEPASVEALYLRMLVFRLVAPLRLEQTEIQRAFGIIQQYGNLVSLMPQPFLEGRKADFSVDLESSAMPASLSCHAGKMVGDLRYVCLESLRQLADRLGCPPLNKESGLSANLSKYFQIRLGSSLAPILGKNSRNSIIIAGFSNLVGAMPQVGAKLASVDGFSDFKLLSQDEHDMPATKIASSKTEGTFKTSAWGVRPLSKGSAALGMIASGTACRVSPAETPGFYVIESPGIALPVGGLVGLFTDNKLIQFGQVCPGCNELVPHEYGFELLASDVGLARVVFDANPKKTYRCFFSGNGDGTYSLITPPLRLRGGDVLLVDRRGYGDPKERFRIARLLGKTVEYCQFEIIPESPAQSS